MGKTQITVSEMAKRGAVARNKKLTARQRSEAARHAATLRWRKHREKSRT